VDVVECDHDWLLDGEIEEEASNGGEHLVARARELALVPARLTDQLPQRPERDSFAVRRAAADENRRLGVEGGEELAREPRLADAGLADDRHEPSSAAGDNTRVHAAQPFELALTSDEA
jgi:hypothetical protein